MKLFGVVALAIVLIQSSISAGAFTLTFDDIPAGQDMRTYYWTNYRIDFSAFSVIDASELGWVTPHSDTKILACPDAMEGTRGSLSFKTTGNNVFLHKNSVGGYFSTKPGVIVRLDAYSFGTLKPVASMLIGSTDGAWNNTYAEISAPSIDWVFIDPISSPDALSGLCMDDLTFTPVPEPSSIAAMLLSVCGMAGMALRKRK